MNAAPPLVEVRNLRVEFVTPLGTIRAVDDVSFRLDRGETLGVLGESGSGKSVSALAMMGLITSPPGRISNGQILFHGQDLLRMPPHEAARIQGQRISMIFQDAITSLNPGLTVGFQVGEALRVHRGMSRADARTRAIELMDRVGIPSAARRVDDYPHQFSGGMNQRVMIAMALALDPELLIADEPTTALDVTVQAQIMQLLQDLQRDTGMAIILITHDIGVVAEMADRLCVMYAGRVVESGPIAEVFDRPAHPYTIGLMRSVPQADMKDGQLYAIPGSPPQLTRIPAGCPFAPRCNRAEPVCTNVPPPQVSVSPQHRAMCHFVEDGIHV